MSNMKEASEKIIEGVTEGYKKAESAVVGVVGIALLLMRIPMFPGLK